MDSTCSSTMFVKPIVLGTPKGFSGACPYCGAITNESYDERGVLVSQPGCSHFHESVDLGYHGWHWVFHESKQTES